MQRWVMVKRIHQAALERESTERAAFLDEACTGDEALRREVDSLLACETAAAPFMESPALAVAALGLRAAPPPALIGRTLSHYQVHALLGAGGMGEVYLAHDPRLDRAVALKILPPDFAFDADRMRRFSREARAASALNHPNVATIYDIGESDALQFIAMEYVEGQTLADKIAGQPMALGDIAEIGLQVADALEAAHARGVIHRDIKPANLMLTPRGQVKVLDFGVARTTRTESAAPGNELPTGVQTAVGSLIGSLPYMSPEQVRGREVDHRSDLFSLGVTLYEMATAHLPFAGATSADTQHLILHATPAPFRRPGEFLEELERITFKCLEKDVEQRYQSAGELVTALRNLRRQIDEVSRPVRSGDIRRHNLPTQLTSFIGRQREIAEVRQLLTTTRLLTLAGAGGCGKTRLGLQVAGGVLEQFPDGVWVVDLSPLSEPDLVTSSVAAVLRVQEGLGRSLVEVLSEYVRARRLLLVLDNCEHLIDACAQLVETLLRAASTLHILATSREGLGISGETVWRVPSLSVPAAQPVPDEEWLQYEAIRLFAERAAAVDAAFTIDRSNAPAVAELCRRLDGIPLAIELAAARLRVLSLDQINSRLTDRFRLLTGGSRTAVARQRTLEATVDWSYNLLSNPERRLFCRLSVFAGGWTLDAAEDVCSGGTIKKAQMVDLLSNLVDKSLVVVEEHAGVPRYRFLETVRQYGRERLLRSGEAGRVRDRHRDFFFALAARAEPELIRAEQGSWLNRLQSDHDNLRAALEWSLAEPARGKRLLPLAAALFWFWVKRGFFSEGRQWLEHALRTDIDAPPALRAKAHLGVSNMTYFQGDFATVLNHAEQSLALGRQTEDRRAIVFSLFMQALVAVESGRAEDAVRLAVDGEPIARASGDPWLQSLLVGVRAFAAKRADDYETAGTLFEEAVAFARLSEDRFTIGIFLADLAESRVLQRRHGEARALAAEGVQVCHEAGNLPGAALCIDVLAIAHAAQGQVTRAARLWGASDAMYERMGVSLAPVHKRVRGMYFDAARDSLGERAFDAALSEGRILSLTEASKYALAGT